jgi:hypothetical protein
MDIHLGVEGSDGKLGWLRISCKVFGVAVLKLGAVSPWVGEWGLVKQ